MQARTRGSPSRVVAQSSTVRAPSLASSRVRARARASTRTRAEASTRARTNLRVRATAQARVKVKASTRAKGRALLRLPGLSRARAQSTAAPPAQALARGRTAPARAPAATAAPRGRASRAQARPPAAWKLSISCCPHAGSSQAFFLGTAAYQAVNGHTIILCPSQQCFLHSAPCLQGPSTLCHHTAQLLALLTATGLQAEGRG